MRAGWIGAVIAAACLVGCFEIRPLDRVFDGGADAVTDGGPADAPPPAPGCEGPDDTCDGIDDDCDGIADEDVPTETCGVGQCRETAAGGRCVSGVYLECTPGAPQEETCNDLDDDCDGTLDEGLERPCEGDCGAGVETCRDGRWSACAIAEVDEICDGEDNDCDGATDEDLTRPCDTPCGPGTEICRNGRWRNCEGPAAALEECNGLDDDCDGETDELEPRPCEPPPGECAPATEVCAGGAWAPCTGPPAQPEACNEVDDDCDGIVDEDACEDCALEVQWTCYEFVGPCPPGPGDRETRCVLPIGGAVGEPGDGMGRRIVRAGDLDGDDVHDFVAVGDIGVMAVSGRTGERIWYLGEEVASDGDVVVLRPDDRPLVITGDLADAPLGELNVIDGEDGEFLRRVDSDGSMIYGGRLAAVPGAGIFATGDPEARDGQGRLQFFSVNRAGDNPQPIGVDIMTGPGLGRALALGRDEQNQTVMAVTVGPEDEARVQLFTDPAEGGAIEPADLILPGPGVGTRLAIESIRTDQVAQVLSLDTDAVRLTVAAFDQQRLIRMPLGAPGLDVSVVPIRNAADAPTVLVSSHGLVEMLTFGDNEQVAVVSVPGPVDDRWGAAVAGAPLGPDGRRVMAVGAPDAAGGAGRIDIYRVD